MAVLERDTLGIREVRLFTAVVRWSEAECQRQQLQVTPENKRKVLGKALALIHFPLMTIEEFAAGNRGTDKECDPECESRDPQPGHSGSGASRVRVRTGLGSRP